MWRCTKCRKDIAKGCFACLSGLGETRRRQTCDAVTADGVSHWKCRVCGSMWLASTLQSNPDQEVARVDAASSSPIPIEAVDRQLANPAHDVPKCRVCRGTMHGRGLYKRCRQRWQCPRCSTSVVKGCTACATLSEVARRRWACDDVMEDGVARWRCRHCGAVWLPSSCGVDLPRGDAGSDGASLPPTQDGGMDIASCECGVAQRSPDSPLPPPPPVQLPHIGSFYPTLSPIVD